MRNGTIRVLLLAAALTWGAAPRPAPAAEGLQVEADVSQTLVNVGDRVDYTVKVTPGGGGTPRWNLLRIARAPQFERLAPLSAQPSSSQNDSFVNGAWSHLMQVTWPLVANAEGTAKVSGGQLSYDGKTYDMPERTIKVVKDVASAVTGELAGENILPARTSDAGIDKQLAGRLFARLTFSNSKPYLQETIVAECVLYLDGLSNVVGSPTWTAPGWDGFFSAAEKMPESMPLREATLGGKRYEVVTIGRVYLTPTRAGAVEIATNEAQCLLTVQSRARSFEDMLFNDPFGRRLQVQLPIAATKLDVQPLPEEGRPASFGNAVGQFEFAANADRTEMTTDDLLTLRCEVAGEGFLGSVAEPKLPEMPDWEQVGAPQSRTEAVKGGSALQGKKTFEYVLRPRKTGRLTVPAVAYAFFDPAKKAYVERTQGPLAVAVTKGQDRPLIVASGPAASGAATAPTAAVPDVFGERLAYIHTAVPRSAALAPPLYARPAFGLLALAPVVLLGLAFGARGWRDYREENRDRLNVRSAGARARRELHGAASALARGDLAACHTQISEAMRQYLATKLGRAAAGLTLDEVEAAVRERGLTDADARELRRLLERCDLARYAPVAADDAAARRVYDDAAAWLRRLDDLLSSRPAAGRAA